jgi:hypothetical protein
LLLALILPLQGYAAMPACGQPDPANSSADSATAAAATATASQAHCTRGPAATHHHSCGNCCCGNAIALTSVHRIAPLLTAPAIAMAVLGSPPEITLDRLDRPPRFIPA